MFDYVKAPMDERFRAAKEAHIDMGPTEHDGRDLRFLDTDKGVTDDD